MTDSPPVDKVSTVAQQSLKRKREEGEKEVQTDPKAARVECSIWDYTEHYHELFEYILSFLNRSDLLKMKLNRPLKSFVERIDTQNRRRELEKLVNLIHYLSSVDWIDLYPQVKTKLPELENSINIEERLKDIKFNLTQFLTSTHFSLIKILENVEMEHLVSLSFDSVPLPRDFENFLDVLCLIKMEKDSENCYEWGFDENADGYFGLNPETALSNEIGLYKIFIYIFQMEQLIVDDNHFCHDRNYNGVHHRLKKAFEFNPADTEGIHATALEIITFARADHYGIATQKLIIEKLKSRNSLDSYLEQDIKASIFYLLNQFRQFELAKELLKRLPNIAEMSVSHEDNPPNHFNTIMRTFDLLKLNNIELMSEYIGMISFLDRVRIRNNIIERFFLEDNIEKALDFINRFSYSWSWLQEDEVEKLFNLEWSSDQVGRALQYVLSLPVTMDENGRSFSYRIFTSVVTTYIKLKEYEKAKEASRITECGPSPREIKDIEISSWLN